MSLGPQPDPETLLHRQAAPEFFHESNLSCFLLLRYLLLYLFAHTRRHETFSLLIKKKKKCCTGRFKVRQDDGELSIIPCFHIAVLLPVQSSMHGWTGPTLGRSLPGRQGSPGCVGRRGSCYPACIPVVMHPPPCSSPLHSTDTDCLEDLSPKS